MKKNGIFPIVCVLGEVALPLAFKMHQVFNIKDPYPFHGDGILPTAIYDPSQTSLLPTDKVYIVLDYKASDDRTIVDRHYINWKNRPKSEKCWIIVAQLQQIDPDFFVYMQDFHLRASVSKKWENDVFGVVKQQLDTVSRAELGRGWL